MKEEIRETLLRTGAVAVGFAKAGEIDPEVRDNYIKWIEEGNHGDMGYMERHIPLREHTDNVLQGAKTVISVAYGYSPTECREEDKAYISTYAFGKDYHIYLKERLRPVIKSFKEKYGGEWRVCIDSAPVAERYWATKSGIGKRGLNGMIIVEDYGAFCFLVDIMTTLEIVPDMPSGDFCDQCRKCIEICPSQALKGDGTMDARKCINYLTIEKRGELTKEEKLLLNQDSGYLFGCDRCIHCCPHNKNGVGTYDSPFAMTEEIRELTPERILSIEAESFKKLFTHSPLLYAGYDRLLRNARILKRKTTGNS